MDSGAGRTVHWIMVFADTVRDIAHLFHAGIVLLSSPNSSEDLEQTECGAHARLSGCEPKDSFSMDDVDFLDLPVGLKT